MTGYIVFNTRNKEYLQLNTRGMRRNSLASNSLASNTFVCQLTKCISQCISQLELLKQSITEWVV